MKLKSILFGVALFVSSIVAPASADHLPSIMPCTLTSGNATICASITNGVPGVLFGIVNNSVNAQLVSVTCYDNGTAANGPVVASIAPLGPSQFITWPAGGRLFVNGLTCQASGAPTGAGIEIYMGTSNS